MRPNARLVVGLAIVALLVLVALLSQVWTPLPATKLAIADSRPASRIASTASNPGW